MMKDARRLSYLTFASLNAIFIIGHPALQLTNSGNSGSGFATAALQSLCVGLVITFVPGLPFSLILAKRATNRLVWAFGLSIVIFGFAVLCCHFMNGGVLTSVTVWNWVWLVANLGLMVGVLVPKPRRFVPSQSLRVPAIVLFLVVFLFYFWGATKVVPELDDHDLEVTGTGYGLLHRGKPLLLTDRNTVYFFAHPPLLHVQVAGAFLFFNRLEVLKQYFVLSELARKTSQPESRWALLSEIYRHFHRWPEKVSARTVNVVLASATVLILLIWSARLSRNTFLAFSLVIAYATNPEVFVRSSYGGYFAIDEFCCVLMLATAIIWQSKQTWGTASSAFLAGGLAALADHKLIVLPFTMAMVLACNPPLRMRRSDFVRHPICWGFAAGVVVFLGWGLSINVEAFWQDHVRTHLLDRVIHNNPLGYGGYPSVSGLWLEFLRHTGYLLLPMLAIAAIIGLRNPTTLSTICLSWFLLNGVVFSIVDWRMTKHLMPSLIVFPLVVSQAARGNTVLARCFVAAALLIICWNVWMIAGIVLDFRSFQPHPAW
jgi:hypothetical protein